VSLSITLTDLEQPDAMNIFLANLRRNYIPFDQCGLRDQIGHANPHGKGRVYGVSHADSKGAVPQRFQIWGPYLRTYLERPRPRTVSHLWEWCGPATLI